MGELTPLGISVLALLNERPMHPYEMYQLLIERHEDRIVKVRPGSLYHTVERLVDHELVRATGTERAGNRPERTNYEITDKGRVVLTDRVAEMVAVPVNEYPSFLVALAECHNLARGEVLARLRERHDRLDELLDDIDGLMKIAADKQTDGVFLLAAEYTALSYRTERDWVAGLVDRIESKELPWPTP